jgi:aspartyl-tRNA(Asn)/glutamyl-tRNA(Gln) amidotransferase subunit A
MGAGGGRLEEQASELCALGVGELCRLYRAGKVSPVDVTAPTLARITGLNPELRAYLAVDEEAALAAARAAEQQILAGGDLGPLHGVPVAVKDLIRVRGTRTTAASRVLLDAPPDKTDAPVVQRLRAAGAVVIGKLNLHEFAFGEPDPDGPFGDVQNPRKLGHQAGSSSSGSAAAVAAGLAVAALGTDTGGSIRHPASVCGVVGLKPTYGLVPLRGVIPLSPSLDHVGPLARSVEDVAAVLTAIAGHDPDDPTSIVAPIPDYRVALGRDVRGLRLGLPTNPFYRFGHAEPLTILERGRQALLDLGLAPVPVVLPRAEETNGLSRTIIDVDAWLYHEQFRDREALYGRDFRDRARAGRETPAIAYARAQEAQADIRRRWLGLFERMDLLLLPGNVAAAPRHGVRTIVVDGEAYPVPMVTSRFNRAANVTGLPALTLPVGGTADGLPVALQLVGPPLGEARLLAVAHALEQALGNLPARWGIEPRR